jgi:hypothetical protein
MLSGMRNSLSDALSEAEFRTRIVLWLNLFTAARPSSSKPIFASRRKVTCVPRLFRNRTHGTALKSHFPAGSFPLLKSDSLGSKDAVAVSAEVRKRRDFMAPGRIKAKKRKGRKSRAPRDRYGVASYRRAIHRACDLAKIERWSPNRLRHTAATRVRREMGIDAARALLGHSDADTTTIYAERDQELARTAMERLG